MTVGSASESSKIKLHSWLEARRPLSTGKKGISAKQFERMLGVSYEAAWFMVHPIPEATKIQPAHKLGEGGGSVGVIQTY